MQSFGEVLERYLYLAILVVVGHQKDGAELTTSTQQSFGEKLTSYTVLPLLPSGCI